MAEFKQFSVREHSTIWAWRQHTAQKFNCLLHTPAPISGVWCGVMCCGGVIWLVWKDLGAPFLFLSQQLTSHSTGNNSEFNSVISRHDWLNKIRPGYPHYTYLISQSSSSTQTPAIAQKRTPPRGITQMDCQNNRLCQANALKWTFLFKLYPHQIIFAINYQLDNLWWGEHTSSTTHTPRHTQTTSHSQSISCPRGTLIIN